MSTSVIQIKVQRTLWKRNRKTLTLPLLRIGNKTPMEGVSETKFGAHVTLKYWASNTSWSQKTR
jgi:hypothetical protein